MVRSLLLAVLIGLSPTLATAAETVTKLDKLMEENFASLSFPESRLVRAQNHKQEFPYTDVDRVWHSLILVTMQMGVIASSSKDKGKLILVPRQNHVTELGFFSNEEYYAGLSPLAVLVEGVEAPTVYLYWMPELYEDVEKPGRIMVDVSLDHEKALTEQFFGLLSTQVYSNEKWEYLFK